MGKQSDNRNRLLVLYECGIKSAKKLHQFTGIPLSTIYDHLKRFQTGKGSKRKVGSGRPPKLSANDRRRVAQLANFHEKWSATRIAQRAHKKGSPLVSRQTICRVLKEQGFLKLVPKIVPLLTQQHKDERVRWCQKYLNLDWAKVCFSDESKFEFYRCKVKVWCKARKSRPKPKFS